VAFDELEELLVNELDWELVVVEVVDEVLVFALVDEVAAGVAPCVVLPVLAVDGVEAAALA
jgi:hypothetical protein